MRNRDWIAAAIFWFAGCVLTCVAKPESATIASDRDVAAGTQAASQSEAQQQPTEERSRAGLLALYDFQSAEGDVVRDRAGVGRPAHLKITNPNGVRRTKGALQIVGDTAIQAEAPSRRISEAIASTGEVSIEAWIRPDSTDQSGPARIVSLSKNSSERNVTLGQDGGKFDVRLRTNRTSTNGIPSVSTDNNSLKTELTHVVYTRDRSGRTRIYLNGEVAKEQTVEGETSNWDRSHRLTLANEHGGGRLWKGTYHFVALFNRDLLPHEVKKHFALGENVTAGEHAGTRSLSASATLFETKVAAILVEHCFECHDSSTAEGGLDLAHRTAAAKGGDSGDAIVPGKPAQSLAWKMVESDEMPENRNPLDDEEKQLLKQWIAEGADWSVERIDPELFAHGGKPLENWVRRLTRSEYIETVRSSVGVDIAADAYELLPPDLRADGFSNTAYNLGVDLEHIEAYAELATRIVGKMDVIAFVRRFGRDRRLDGDTQRKTIASMGKWMLRGPLDAEEVNAFMTIISAVRDHGGSYEESMSYVIEAMLQSPRFIYQMEQQSGDGDAWPISEYELAARMSYIVWGGPPDEELIKAAEEGRLYENEGMRGQIDRMLTDQRASRRAREFASEWLNLSRLANLNPNADKFPDWNARLAEDMKRETLDYFTEIAWTQDRPLTHLLNAQTTFVSPRLAAHYGLAWPADQPTGDDAWIAYDLSSNPNRGGLLTHGSVLTVGGDEASMVSRGLFVLHDVLRGSVKDPPPCVNTTPPPTQPGLTQRGIAEARIADVSCGGCHVKFEPLAFGLERFDGIGAFHEADEHGNALRDDGEILFPETRDPIEYQTSAALMDLLAGSDRVSETIAWKLTQFALGRPLVATDLPALEEIHRNAIQAGGTYRAMIKEILLSDIVRTMRTEKKE